MRKVKAGLKVRADQRGGPWLLDFESRQPAVSPPFESVICHGSVRVVLQRVLEISGGPFDHNLFMHRTILETAGSFLEETETVVRVPSSVADPPTREEILPRDEIALAGILALDDFFNFFFQREGDPLIGIEASGSSRRWSWSTALFFLAGEPFPRFLVHLAPRRFAMSAVHPC